MTTPAGVPLVEQHDALLVDLDGVVYTGATAVPGAVAALRRAGDQRSRLVFVTNNASRTPADITAQLARLGLEASADDVVTSAEAAADYLAHLVPAASPVLVVGGDGLVAAVTARGLRPVAAADERPLAVVQGFGRDVGWRQLAEAAVAVAGGVPWVATNRDLTFPTERGLAPGNGALVAAVAVASGGTPVTIGKPEPLLFSAAAARVGAKRPLVVGDRLDTDIAGAGRAGFASLLVLTGVSGVREVLLAPAGCRPDHVAIDLGGLHMAPVPAPVSQRGGIGWDGGGWRSRVEAGRLQLTGSGDPAAGLRCAAAAAWSAADAGAKPDVDEVVEVVEQLTGRPQTRG